MPSSGLETRELQGTLIVTGYNLAADDRRNKRIPTSTAACVSRHMIMIPNLVNTRSTHQTQRPETPVRFASLSRSRRTSLEIPHGRASLYTNYLLPRKSAANEGLGRFLVRGVNPAVLLHQFHGRGNFGHLLGQQWTKRKGMGTGVG